MKRVAPAALLLMGVLALYFSSKRMPAGGPAPRDRVATRRSHASMPAPERRKRPVETPSPPARTETVDPSARESAERQIHAGAIERDYEAIRLQVIAAYGAEGEALPGGSHTLVAQLALLEREKHADLARVLGPRALEEMELRETRAGQRVQRALAGSPATDEQRRAVFRLQRAFDLAHGSVAAPMPGALDQRSRAQQALAEQIRAVLGDELFRVWTRQAASAE